MGEMVTSDKACLRLVDVHRCLLMTLGMGDGLGRSTKFFDS